MKKKNTAPIIGITCSMEYDDEKRKYPTAYAFDYLKRNYNEAVEKSGGIPIVLPNTTKTDNVKNILELVDGLLISGGNDVVPVFYGEKRKAKNLNLTPERDRFEIAVVKKAGGRDIPIFGICRGMQLINVVFGGNLYQDSTFEKQFLNHTLEGSTVYKKRHPVIIKEESLLYRIIQKKRIMVNTSHHQMVKTVGTGLITSAWSEEDGVVEAIEAADDNFLLCVQWHPELIPDKNSKALFDWLVKSAKEYKLNKD